MRICWKEVMEIPEGTDASNILMIAFHKFIKVNA